MNALRLWWLRYRISALRDRARMLDSYALGYQREAEQCRVDAARLTRGLRGPAILKRV
jgi:hypothetical protein